MSYPPAPAIPLYDCGSVSSSHIDSSKLLLSSSVNLEMVFLTSSMFSILGTLNVGFLVVVTAYSIWVNPSSFTSGYSFGSR